MHELNHRQSLASTSAPPPPSPAVFYIKPPPTMKILESQSATLTNHEVLTHISTHPRLSLSTSPGNTSQPTNTTTVLAEVTRYLTSFAPSATNPSSTSPLPPHLPATQIKQLVRELGKFGLTKAEMLMVVNLAPTELGLLDCVVEELDERLGEQEQGELVGIVERVVGEAKEEKGAVDARDGSDGMEVG
ncbi:MAG: hypothetical protein Q9209_007208 [Squamulea sp. 1 TL-2023]